MQEFNWQSILQLKEVIPFSSFGLIAGEDTLGVIEVGEHIYTQSAKCHSKNGFAYENINGFIWAENLANAKRIVSRVPVPLMRNGMCPPDLLKPYDCGWSYDEMFLAAQQDSIARKFFCNWLPETQTMEIMLDMEEGFSQLRYQDKVDLAGKMIQIEGKSLYYDVLDFSAPYAVHYDVLNQWDG